MTSAATPADLGRGEGVAVTQASDDGHKAPLAGGAGRHRRLDTVPFVHERRLVSVLTEDDHRNGMIITKGAPEGLLNRCTAIPAAARTALDAEFAAGNRVIAAATREMPDRSSITTTDENDRTFRCILVFLDPRLHLRLRHLRHHAVGVPRRRGSVQHRLVRGIPGQQRRQPG